MPLSAQNCFYTFLFPRTFQPFHNYSRGDPLEDLHNCGRKINVLQKEIGKEGRENLDMRLKSFKVSQLKKLICRKKCQF